MYKAVIITGPTGVGKSDIAIKLALSNNGEIISADSVQIYKGFDIGSAKITKDEMKSVTHHAIDICNPNQEFSVFDFVQYTKNKIKEIASRGKLPIIVGGTGLYLKSLLRGYNFGDAQKHQDFRDAMQNLASTEGNMAVWNLLFNKDKTLAEKIPANNLKRVIRALEIKEYGTQSIKGNVDIAFRAFAINMDRAKLYENINNRVDKMIKKGLLQEVKSLLNGGVSVDGQAMQAIGYKEMVAFINGKQSLEDTINLIKQHTRNYAKRQLTFLRGMDEVEIVEKDQSSYSYIDLEIKKFVKGV